MGSPHPSRRATYDDVLATPPGQVAELIDGELYTSPRPAASHSRASSRLGAELGPPFDRGRGGPGGWIILDEPELHLGEQVLVPDLVGWRRTRMPELPEAAFFTLAPDWVCEVLSPSTMSLDRVRKMAVYSRAGVEWTWLIDPAARTLEVFRSGPTAGTWTRTGSWEADSRVRAEPFDAIELELGLLWER